MSLFYTGLGLPKTDLEPTPQPNTRVKNVLSYIKESDSVKAPITISSVCDQLIADLGTPIQDKDNRAQAIPSTSSNTEISIPQLVEAQEWIIGADGEVVLTTQSLNVTPYQPWLTAANCHTPQS